MRFNKTRTNIALPVKNLLLFYKCLRDLEKNKLKLYNFKIDRQLALNNRLSSILLFINRYWNKLWNAIYCKGVVNFNFNNVIKSMIAHSKYIRIYFFTWIESQIASMTIMSSRSTSNSSSLQFTTFSKKYQICPESIISKMEYIKDPWTPIYCLFSKTST